MSRFYLLPARPSIGGRFAEFLKSLFPGTDWPRGDWHDLAEALSAAAMSEPDVYVVFAEDLPAGLSQEHGLIECFGAEAGDEIIEIRPGKNLAEVATHRWRVHESLAA